MEQDTTTTEQPKRAAELHKTSGRPSRGSAGPRSKRAKYTAIAWYILPALKFVQQTARVSLLTTTAMNARGEN
jgi:hypothetical protein